MGSEDLINEAKEFFEAYKQEIGRFAKDGKKTVQISFQDLASHSHEISELLIQQPEETLRLLELALEETGLIANGRIRLLDLPLTQLVRIREIRAKHLGQMIMIEGLIRQASDVRPQVVNAKFECPNCGSVISVLQIDKNFREPTRCSCGRKGGFKLLSKDMVDAQRIVIEESTDQLTGAEQPRRLSIFLKEDLVEPRMAEKTTPGSRIKVVGVLKEVPIPLKTGAISTRFDLAVEANSIIPLEESFSDLKISEEDERQIKELASDPQLYIKLRESIAPSVMGLDEIKEALVLQLLGGVRREKSDGTFSRGDMHLLLVGDPGVAKSIGKNERIMYISDKEAGYDTIENLYKKFKGSPKNLKVLTIDMKKHEPMWEQVNEIIKHLPEKDLLKISTEHGKSIVATKDHSFITLSKNGEIVPIKGEELTKDTYVPIPVNYHKEEFKYFLPGNFNKKNTNSKILPDKIKLDRDFGFFMGIFLAEGYVKSQNAIEISNGNKEIQKRVMAFSKKINLNCNLNDKSVILFSKNLSDILMAYSYDSEDLKKIKRGIKGNFSRIKKIPDFAYFSPKEFIYGLISGLFSGDGRLIKDKKMLKGFELITVSKSLAEGTSDLLFSIGILNRVKRREYTYNSNKTDYYSLAIPTPMIEKFAENMQILGREIRYNKNKPIYSYNNLIPCGALVYELVKKLGYNRRINGNRTLAAEMRTVKRRKTIGRLRLINLIKEFENRAEYNLPELDLLKKIVNSNIIWSKIKDIENLKKKNEEVYDLFIPGTNTFVSNGIGVHNSVLLKFISKIAPKGRYISGKSTTAAGLTATVVKDEFLRGWSLEAGAMVLANKGLCAIDEIEDMSEEDRSSMHEAMEQQCYHYDTCISMADGSERKIGEIVEEILLQNQDKIIQGKDCMILPVDNLEILTTDWKKVFKTKAARISKHKAFDKFIKIKFGNGREIKVTPEHPVFCAGKESIMTKRADEIKIGEDIPIPLFMPIEGEQQRFIFHHPNKRAQVHIRIPDKNGGEIFKIAGYLVSEGSRELNRGKLIGVNFTNKDPRVLENFEECMKSEFGIQPYKQLKIDEHEGRYTYRYISTELAEFFRLNMPEILKLSDKKEIPQILMKGRREDIAKMLSALFEGDGYISVKTRTIRIGYKTKSKRLSEQIQDLLLRFGIRSNITADREYFRVGITSYDNIQKFMQEIRFITQEKNDIITEYLQEKTIKRTVKDIIPKSFNEKIIGIIKDERIEKVGEYKTYDIAYDHLKREDKFSFSANFLKNLLLLVKKDENKNFLQALTGNVGWEKVAGIEVIENENEKWVYDITIEPNHAFISQAAVLHNTVSISKANVQASLKSETSVLAAGNPKFGRFDLYQPIAQQINIDIALLTRFDLIFVLKDLPERNKDEAIANHVLMERRNENAQAKRAIDPHLLRKYLAYAKQNISPELTDKAIEEIKRFYVNLRNMPTVSNDLVKPIPVTARQLEALIRLSEAHAKARLSKKITREDALRAIDILKFCLMQIGFDYETKQFDIDKLSTGVTASQKNKILIVKEAIVRLESRLGKLIPIEEISKELGEKMDNETIEDVVEKLAIAGDIFKPKRGFIQRM